MDSDLNRRKFLKVLGGAAAATAVNATDLFAGRDVGHMWADIHEPADQAKSGRIAVLWDAGLLQLSGLHMTRDLIEGALKDWKPVFLSPAQVKNALRLDAFDLFIDPYGPVFPVEAWEAIESFLRGGGHWLHFGGAPFALPVELNGSASGSRRVGELTTAFHKKLGITQCFPVSVADPAATLSVTDFGPLADWVDGGSELTVDELYVRLAVKSDVPGEEEGEGVRQAVLNPLVVVMSKEGRPIAAPVIEMERIAGTFAGGRWVMGNYRGTPSPLLLRWMVRRALIDVTQVTVAPSFACYHKGEKVSLGIHLSVPATSKASPLRAQCRIEILDDRGSVLRGISHRLDGVGPTLDGHIDVPDGSWNPGFYRVRAKCTCSIAGSEGEELFAENGFWFFDEELFRSGPAYGVSRDYLTRDGKAYPVTGTTYMSSDAHRHFLLAPNPSAWEKDFTAIKRAGANMVRTGLWTGWNAIAPEGGRVDESVLRAFEAYMLTARKHDIPVIFTFFAFLPPSWGGKNPFLDPNAVAAQCEFVGGFAALFAPVRGLFWDFINEPSFCSAENLWKCRPNYDGFEIAAWHDWVEKQTMMDRPGGRSLRLADAWRNCGVDPFTLPSLDDFIDTNIIGDLVPAKAAAYRRFAQEAFAGWARQLRDRIAARGSKSQLVTVGQDEGGIWERPSQFFYSESVDFTCNHTWWLNDDLLWDGIMSKTPLMPNLIEETGVMFYEQANGLPWRTEEDARDLLDRKMALSFAGGGAGFIQWLWNTNVLQPSDNEVAIGFLRADGTAKPELDAFERIARIIRDHAGEFGDRRSEEVVMIIPYSNLYAVRTVTLDATKRCVRTMEYACDIPLRALSEYSSGRCVAGCPAHPCPIRGSVQRRCMAECPWCSEAGDNCSCHRTA